MKYGKQMLLLLLFTFLLIKVSAITISGKVIGLNIEDKIRIENLNGELIAEVNNNNGEFVIEGAITAPSIYTISLGDYKQTLYIDKDIRISGFLNSNGVNSKLTFKGSENNNVFVKDYLEINGKCTSEENHYLNIVSDKNSTSSEVDDALGHYSYMFRKQETCKEMVRAIKNPDMQSAIAYMFRGSSYDTAKYMYELLSDSAKSTYSGKMLLDFMESKSFLRIGAPAPDFEMKDVNGKVRKLKDFKGKVVVLDFWASWCGSCRAEMQYLKQIYPKLDKEKIVFVSINLDDVESTWKKAHDEEQIPWVSVWGGAWKTTKLRTLFDFVCIPHIVVIDKNGNYEGHGYKRLLLCNKLNELK